jgi:hypothetical protein
MLRPLSKGLYFPRCICEEKIRIHKKIAPQNDLQLIFAILFSSPFSACPTVTLIWFRIVVRGHAVAQLVEALRYKSEGGGFNSRWYHWKFVQLHNPSGRNMSLGLTQPVTEMSTRNISWVIKAAGALG